HFIEEFWDTTKRSKEELRNNPMKTLFRPEWNENVDPKKLAAAKNFQRAVVNLLGVRTPIQKGIVRAKEKLYESVFDKYGENAADFLQDHMLSRIDDPITAIRSFVFSVKFIFNPVQLFRQAQTVTHIMGVA